jgi:tryptophan halogenase
VEPLEATAIAAICEQVKLLACVLGTSNCWIGPRTSEVYSARDARYWDAIRRFLAVHYKYNTRLDTPFWQAAREKTDLAGAEPVCDYFMESGPDALFGETLVDVHDQFGIEGYLTMLVGQRVPYEGLHRPSEAELKAVGAIRDQFKKQAATGYHAEHALSIVRMAKWEWKKDIFPS